MKKSSFGVLIFSFILLHFVFIPFSECGGLIQGPWGRSDGLSLQLQVKGLAREVASELGSLNTSWPAPAYSFEKDPMPAWYKFVGNRLKPKIQILRKLLGFFWKHSQEKKAAFALFWKELEGYGYVYSPEDQKKILNTGGFFSFKKTCGSLLANFTGQALQERRYAAPDRGPPASWGR